MRLETAQIVRRAQVWVCNSCGGQDAKSCGCSNSTAHQEELAAKREANRQAVNRYAEKKRQEKQQSPHNVPNVENIKEFNLKHDEEVTPEEVVSDNKNSQLIYTSRLGKIFRGDIGRLQTRLQRGGRKGRDFAEAI